MFAVDRCTEPSIKNVDSVPKRPAVTRPRIATVTKISTRVNPAALDRTRPSAGGSTPRRRDRPGRALARPGAHGRHTPPALRPSLATSGIPAGSRSDLAPGVAFPAEPT